MTPVSTSVVSVTISASVDSPGVTVYTSSVGSKRCSAPVAGSAPFTCTIGALPGGELHRVQVVACLAIGVCSTGTSGQGFTLPDGTVFSILVKPLESTYCFFYTHRLV